MNLIYFQRTKRVSFVDFFQIARKIQWFPIWRMDFQRIPNINLFKGLAEFQTSIFFSKDQHSLERIFLGQTSFFFSKQLRTTSALDVVFFFKGQTEVLSYIFFKATERTLSALSGFQGIKSSIDGFFQSNNRLLRQRDKYEFSKDLRSSKHGYCLKDQLTFDVIF